MAILKAKAQQDSAVSRVSEGDDVFIRATKDGAVFQADWRQALIMEGRGFQTIMGAFSTGIDGGGTASAIQITNPSFTIRIPEGTSIMPMRIEIAVQDPVGATNADEVDILIGIDQDTMNTDGTWTASPTVYNLNTLHSRASRCDCGAPNTGAGTLPVIDIELAHMQKVFDKGTSVGGVWTSMTLLYEPKVMPIINGPANLYIFFGGSDTTEGFIVCQWLELPTSQM